MFAGKSLEASRLLIMSTQSVFVVRSGAVGPHAITSIGSSITSDKINAITYKLYETTIKTKQSNNKTVSFPMLQKQSLK